MFKTIGYQTLEDRFEQGQHLEDLEINGPYQARRRNAWLGTGYYFWDDDILLAKNWGPRARYGSYVICAAQLDIDESCFDLLGSGSHRRQLEEVFHDMCDDDEINNERITVAYIIEHLREMDAFPYDAIRAYGENSFISVSDEDYEDFVQLAIGKMARVNLHPEVQICLVNQDSLNCRNFMVVYPDEYKNPDAEMLYF